MNTTLIEQLIISTIVIFSTVILYYLIKRTTNKILKLKKTKKQDTLKNFILNIVRFSMIVIDILVILEIFGYNTTTLIASLGVVGVVAGLAVKDILEDFIAGAGLVLDDTYNIGDWVTINNFKGEIIDVGMRNTRIKAYSGDVLIINNGSITQVINHSIENINVIVDVKVSFNEDQKKVEKVLKAYCLKMNEEIKELKKDIDYLGIEKINDSFLEYRIVAEVKNGTQFEVNRLINKTLKEQLDKNNIEIPYEQLVVHNG